MPCGKPIQKKMNGIAPQLMPLTNGGSSRSRDRNVLRRGWNGNYANEKVLNASLGQVVKPATTPFRAVNNAGDYLARKNYSCGGGTQTNASVPGIARLIGNITNNCDGSKIPPSTCNTKFVYDSSDYTKFKKLQSKNRLYGDYSFGGDSNNASYAPFQLVRH
tara:strand:- start:1528 stop:2013 length:486 start_codon:yes stop_codon:yes gene_type:complete